jgi:predicted acetyltransferase
MQSKSTVNVRATAPDEWRIACNTMRAALLTGPISDDDWEKSSASWEDQISFTAWDESWCVGHAGAFRFDTVVPGGARVATAGITRIGVSPTATRQGLLTRMLREVLLASRAEGRPLASLRASEAVIYGRFGFGLAGDGVGVQIDVQRARPVANTAPGSVRQLKRNEILDVVPPLYERVANRPGVISRPMFLWQRYLGDAIEAGAKHSFVVVHSSPDGVDDGFAHATVSWNEVAYDDTTGRGEVPDVWGATPAVELALWDFLLGIDLVRSYDVEERPLDDPLRLAVADIRAYRTRQRFDEQWLRLLDVETALRARSYRSNERVTIAVTDPMFADNTDVFEVSADGVRRCGAAADADLRCEIGALSAAYLGSTAWADLAAVGKVHGDHDHIARADDLFASRPLAWSGSFF